MPLPQALKDKLERIPAVPGVYIMRDRRGVAIYVGKAVNLRSRVRGYFSTSSRDERAFVPLLDRLLGDLEILKVGSEQEALLLENELIKRHKPRFNVLLKDDKDFLTLRLDTRKKYPHLEVWRRPEPDGARYFGPYTSAVAVRKTLRMINRHFQLRTCSDAEMSRRTRPCLQHQIGRCPAPCVRGAPEYPRNVQDTILFLEGRHSDLVDHLQSRMRAASDELAFEEAARLRDHLGAVKAILERQRVVQVGDLAERHAIGCYREGPVLSVQVLDVRGGRLTGGRSHTFDEQEFPTAELLGSLLLQIYERSEPPSLPDEVLLPSEVDGREALAEWLSDRRGRKVRVLVPQRGEKRRLVELAEQNAATSFKLERERSADDLALLERLRVSLNLSRFPHCIEGYDVSQTQGGDAVASRVVMVEGRPDKARYRRYRLRFAKGGDDYAMMREVLRRRLLRGIEEQDLPDLIVVDGGKGQLGVARSVLADAAVDETDVIALAKGRSSSRMDGSGEGAPIPERVFIPGRKDPVVLPPDSAELLLLARLRDEAHRFAVSLHRKLRSKRSLAGRIETIPGIGPHRRRTLLRHFGSFKRLRQASPEEIAEVPGFSTKLATMIKKTI